MRFAFAAVWRRLRQLVNWLGQGLYRLGCSLKRTVDANGLGVAMFLLAAAVLLLVPQMANIWWKLPYRIEGQEASTAIGFWVYVPSVALFTYTSWLVLLRAGPPRQPLTPGISAVAASRLHDAPGSRSLSGRRP